MVIVSNRRGVLRGAVALAPFLAASGRSLGASAPEPVTGVKLLDAWRRLFTQSGDAPFAWWFSGVMFAHVDGLREFPVVETHAIMICRATAHPNGGADVDWRTIGYFSDLERGVPTSEWNNVFTGQRQKLPARFAFGPGRYGASVSGDDFSLTLTETKARINRIILTGAIAEGRVVLNQSEGKLQGFPGDDGALPLLDSPDITELQTRFSFIGPAAGLAAANGALPGNGFFSHVYDALPAWLGFGDRLGSALSKGVMKKAAADDVLDRTVWSHLKQLFPQAFAADRLKLP